MSTESMESYHRNGKGYEDPPIRDYDRLGVERILGKLDRLSAAEVERLKAYEERNHNREGLVRHLGTIIASRRKASLRKASH